MVIMKNNITVCIPTFNRCESLKKTLGHLLSSKSISFSVVVSDNASEDDTWEYLNSLDDTRLIISRNETNIGFTGNILKVLELSPTDFILFMSDEDFVILENIEEIIRTNIDDDVGVFYGGVLHENNSTYYYKYNKKTWKKKEALNKVVLSHSYMSGMIFNKKYLDLNKFNTSIADEDVVLYPHEIMVYMILCNGGKLVTDSLPIAKQGEAVESEAIIKYKYYEYNERLKLFKQYCRVVSNLDYGLIESRIFFKKMAIIASCVFVDEVLIKKIKPKQYLSEIFSLNCGWLFKLQFVTYSSAVFLMRKLKN
ncbi:glycosyltransferase [Aliivibrio fischeri ES114]|uniref:Glycosyltransferase n=2 Tax=Aliivibrio fischeri TaxID=668 RepID=Q5E8G4_ALIF1|nr:glycosyltransferase [Aliivibrio fischeri ES114]